MSRRILQWQGRFIITVFDEEGQPFRTQDFAQDDHESFIECVSRMFSWAENILKQRWTECYSVDEMCKVRQSIGANITILRKV